MRSLRSPPLGLRPVGALQASIRSTSATVAATPQGGRSRATRAAPARCAAAWPRPIPSTSRADHSRRKEQQLLSGRRVREDSPPQGQTTQTKKLPETRQSQCLAGSRLFAASSGSPPILCFD